VKYGEVREVRSLAFSPLRKAQKSEELTTDVLKKLWRKE
jgi:hypothetical protein